MEAELSRALQDVGVKYPDQARTDIRNCLQVFKDLNPKSDNFTFSDGNQRKVVSLNGTIPVRFSGSTYNIPVCLYLLETHPYHPPICYVRPTSDMMIHASKHVDSSGRIYLPYLSEWQFPKCSTHDLVQIMAMIFQETCPVFSRQNAPTNLPYPQTGARMPQPGGRPASFSFGQPSATSYPAQPPYPASPYPTPYPPAGNTPYPSYNPQSSTTSTGGTIKPELFRASLISAVEDRVRLKLRDTLGTAYAEVDSVRRTKEELEKGRSKLQGMLDRLAKEQRDLDSALIVYQEKQSEMEKMMVSAKPTDELAIDDAIDTSSVLHRQLFNAFVEDNAVEDAIYYLGQGLASGRLDLDTYLRLVRKLSRQQFTLRATMIKCRQRAKLPV